MDKFFKVLSEQRYSRSPVKLHSFTTYSGWSLNYIPGEWIKPLRPETRLYVFDTYENAYLFMTNFAYWPFSYWIWECEVIHPLPEKRLASGQVNYDAFWRGLLARDYTIIPPTGTYGVEQLRMTKPRLVYTKGERHQPSTAFYMRAGILSCDFDRT